MLEHLPDALGAALGDMRAGLAQTVFHAVDLRQGMGALRLGSLAFADHSPIPARYTADGDGVSPPLHWSGVPGAAAALVLIVEDADAPLPQPWVHTIALDLPFADDGTGALAEGALSAGEPAQPPWPMGLNSLLQARWLPPDPPPGHGVHRYAFQLFALQAGAPWTGTPGRDAVRSAVQARGLCSGLLIGLYERSGTVPEGLARPGPALIA